MVRKSMIRVDLDDVNFPIGIENVLNDETWVEWITLKQAKQVRARLDRAIAKVEAYKHMQAALIIQAAVKHSLKKQG